MRKRSAYRPKCAPGQIPVTIRCFQEADLGIPVHLALANFSTADDWHTLASRINWGYVASERFEGVREQIMPALAALAETRDSLTLTDEQRAALQAGITLCDRLEQSMTRREIRDDLRTMLALNGLARSAA